MGHQTKLFAVRIIVTTHYAA